MSKIDDSKSVPKKADHAMIFAALGDATRLSLIAQLCEGTPRSITQLAKAFKLSRQAITKHLRVLERAGFVHSATQGREMLFKFTSGSIEPLKSYLESISRRWDLRLTRLKSFVESSDD